MTTNNTIITQSSTGLLSIGTTQPTTPNFWLDGGILTFWNGTTNVVVDYNEGVVTDTFGNVTVSDI